MATYYINADSGDDSTGDGSSGNPWETFNHANSQASDGDTIIFQEASANYSIQTETLTLNLTIKANTLGDATLTGTTVRWEGEGTITVENLIFDGLSAQGASSNKWGLFSPNQNENAVTWNISDCKIMNYTTTDSHWEGGPFSSYMLVSSTEYTLSGANCVFNLSRVLASVSNDGALFAGFLNKSSWHVTNTNCTFILGAVLTYVYGRTNASASVTDKNCIYHASAPTDFETNNWNATSSYSCYYNIATGQPSGTGVITSDPLLVDVDNDNYELRPTSPCINTGTLV